MRIYVTDEHIRAGVKRSGDKCPISLAISEVIGMKVLVGKYHWNTASISEIKTQTNPPEVTEAIVEYDSTGIMKPFDFEIEWEEI